MRIVWSWIEEIIGGTLPPPEEVAGRLTRAGLEVETIERLGRSFSGVVVAEVLAKRPHPKSQKLTLVTVRGAVEAEVVCGAPNVPEPGRLVLWAAPGAKLPDGRTLAAKEVQGVSSPGMLCSTSELGLDGVGEPVADGIIVLTAAEADGVKAGDDAAAALGLEQTVLEIAIPANRPDALGHIGVAREIAALLGRTCQRPEGVPSKAAAPIPISVVIEDPEACPRYTARVIDEVQVGPSPRIIRSRLRACGVRVISNLVDVTNYVLFETGQPLHAFDLDKLEGQQIVVRRARAGETLTTLDGQERKLEPGDILICDARRPVALGGVMGGLDTEVTATTRRVLLESASFHPASIRKTVRRLGLASEASYRFERRVDPEGSKDACHRAAMLLAEVGGGKVSITSVDVYPRPPAKTVISLRPARVEGLLGMSIASGEIARHLRSLELPVEEKGGELVVAVPSFRPDLEREVDLIEEVGRLHGYDDLPATLPGAQVAPEPSGDPLAERLRDILTGAGLDEAITFGFTSRARLAALRLPADHPGMRPLALTNPMREDQAILRTSLVPNLLGAVAKNLAFGESDVRLFEIGAVFHVRPNDVLPAEPRFLVGVLVGSRPDWLLPAGEVDFFDAKGLVERVFAGLHIRCEMVPARSETGFLHPGVAAAILVGGEHVGIVGEVHPETREALGIDRRCFLFEVNLERLGTPPAPQFRPLPRFPAIARDVSFFVDDFVGAKRVEEAFLADRPAILEDIRVLEDYREPGKVPEGKKGMLWSLRYRDPSRTLTDAEVDAVHEALVARALTQLSAQRR
jgi:phenylalanyl-tRNA synthetase beta chain